MVDGKFITDSPTKLVKQGKMSKVPFIASKSPEQCCAAEVLSSIIGDVDDEGT